MFDPYHKWLGIPPSEQPPNHYRLLGISLFESDPDVIDAAANRLMAYLQGCATGPHVALSQKLLNEVAAARLCLLDPKKKKAYDTRLKARAVVPERGFDFERPEREAVDAPRARTTRKTPKTSLLPWVLGCVGLLAVALVVVLGFVLGGSKKEGPRSDEPGNKATPDRAGGKRVSPDKDEQQPPSTQMTVLNPSHNNQLNTISGNPMVPGVLEIVRAPAGLLLQAGSVLVLEPNTDNEETVYLFNDPKNGLVFMPQRPHPAVFPVTIRGNPGPWTRYDPRADTNVVPYFAVID